jgi:PEP-CTERM motif-containing protein
MKKLMVISMLVAAIGFVAGPASAATIYETGFEASGETYGNFTAGLSVTQQSAWTGSDAASVISNTDVISGYGSQSLKVPGSEAKLTLDECTTTLTAEFAIKLSGDKAVHNDGFYLRDSNFAKVARIIFKNGGITAFGWVNVGGPTTWVTVGSFSDNDVVTIKVVADISAQTYDIYFDGATTPVVDDLLFAGTFANVNRCTWDTPGDVSILVDGVSITPEPATMVLLGLGGVGLLIRRRRRA